MKRTPLHESFDQAGHEPDQGFRESLRADLLGTFDTEQLDAESPDDDPADVIDIERGSAHGTATRRRGPRFSVAAAVCVAAAACVALGIGVAGLWPGNSDDASLVASDPDLSDDERLAFDALIEDGELNPLLNMSTAGRPDGWTETRERIATLPECEAFRQATAAIPLGVGAANLFTSPDSPNLMSADVTVYEDATVASQATDAYALPESAACWAATWDRQLEAAGFTDPTSTLIAPVSLPEYAARQETFSLSTSVDGDPPTTYHVVTIQLDRVVLWVTVNEDPLGPFSDRGTVQLTVGPAFEAVQAALANADRVSEAPSSTEDPPE